jgi:hypothetical protein
LKNPDNNETVKLVDSGLQLNLLSSSFFPSHCLLFPLQFEAESELISIRLGKIPSVYQANMPAQQGLLIQISTSHDNQGQDKFE